MEKKRKFKVPRPLFHYVWILFGYLNVETHERTHQVSSHGEYFRVYILRQAGGVISFVCS